MGTLIFLAISLFVFSINSCSAFEYARHINIQPTPLHVAAAEGDVKRVSQLLSHGTKVDLRAPITRATPLHFASWKGQYEAAKFLIDHGADVNAETKWGATAIHYASGLNSGLALNPPCHVSSGLGKNHLSVAKLLIDRGASVNHQDQHRNTALGEAASSNSVNIARLLIEKGAKLNVRGWQYTPLDRATIRGPDVAVLMIERGADVNISEQITKDTPLHNAAQCGFVTLVRTLLSHGANVYAKNQFGNTPLDVARSTAKYSKSPNKMKQTLKLLESAAIKRNESIPYN